MEFRTDIMEEVEDTGSKLKKEEWLRKLDGETLKLLRWALDPAITFGVILDQDRQLGLWNPVQFTSHVPAKDFWKMVDSLCQKLASRDLTGNDAVNTVDAVLNQSPSERCLVWACRILNKDLRSGFSISTMNKAHPGFMEPFAVALAKPYEPDKHELTGNWCYEPKLDGLRMIIDRGVAYTRNGRTIDSVGHIIEAVKDYTGRFVFDGEIMGATEFNEDSGNIRRKGEGPNLTLKYNVFDCINQNEWNTRKAILSFRIRRENLVHALGGAKQKYYEVVKQEDLPKNPTPEQLFKLRDRFIKEGYEGGMIKNLDAPYIFKRSDNLLKLKDFQDADGKVTGWYEGKGKHKGRLGGLVALFDGVETKVGSGFNDEQRDNIWAQGLKLTLGRVIEVQYQNKTPDGSLRFPVFIKFRPDKE